MSNKLDAFWAARELLMVDVDRRNDAIRYKFDVELTSGNAGCAELTTPIPKFEKGPTIEEVLELAKKIHEFIDPHINTLGSKTLLIE